MSAIATPLIHSTATISGSSDPVNVETCRSITKVTVNPATGVNSKGTYAIVFHHNENGVGTPNQTEWKFEDEAARDAEYDLLIAMVSTVVA